MFSRILGRMWSTNGFSFVQHSINFSFTAAALRCSISEKNRTIPPSSVGMPGGLSGWNFFRDVQCHGDVRYRRPFPTERLRILHYLCFLRAVAKNFVVSLDRKPGPSSEKAHRSDFGANFCNDATVFSRILRSISNTGPPCSNGRLGRLPAVINSNFPHPNNSRIGSPW